MIQIREFIDKDLEKASAELAKLIDFLDKENIEYDLDIPRKFKGWHSSDNIHFYLVDDELYEFDKLSPQQNCDTISNNRSMNKNR